MFFVWDEAYNTGVDVIDHQHRRIVEYINALHNAALNGDQRGVADVVEQLIEYTVGHFAYEEEMLAQHAYADLEEHKEGHARFTRKIHGYQEQLRAGEDITDALLKELKAWLSGHIQSEDFKYVSSLPSKMRKGAKGKLFGNLLN